MLAVYMFVAMAMMILRGVLPSSPPQVLTLEALAVTSTMTRRKRHNPEPSAVEVTKLVQPWVDSSVCLLYLYILYTDFCKLKMCAFLISLILVLFAKFGQYCHSLIITLD